MIEIKNKLTIMPKEYLGTLTIPDTNRYNYPTCKPECMSIIYPDNIRARSDYYISRDRCIRTINVHPSTSLDGVVNETIDPNTITNFI